jgi:PTH1 family peptidyl-tRNA hydrolase
MWGPCQVNGEKVFLLKPMTYMNLSGIAVKGAVLGLGINLDEIMIVYDDIALPFGRIRFRTGGSAGGHRGMVSVIGHLGSAEIARIRIGIGGSDPDRELADYVTDPFSREELSLLPSICDRAADSVLLWISRGPDEAMRVTNAPPDRSRGEKSGD